MLQEKTALLCDTESFDDPVVIDDRRLKSVRDRLIDELLKGARLVDFSIENVEVDKLRFWMESPFSGLYRARRIGEKSVSERIVEALESRFLEIDQAGIDYRLRCPVRVETTVTRALIDGAETARNLCEWVDFCAPPGMGKTEAKAEYIARSIKASGFDCPVWSVDLDEACISTRAVLALISREIVKGCVDEKSEFSMSQSIVEATRNKRGLLFVDEGQHLADAMKKMGVPIINLLRRFVDRGCFGIVYLGNGEIYRRLSTGIGRDKGAYTQLLSRMRDFRVEVGGYQPGASSDGKRLTREDVLSVANAWGVSGVEEAAYCLKIAQGPGALRAVTNVFRVAMATCGSLDIKALNAVRAV